MKIGSKALFLFLDGVFGLGLGYIFWIIVARFQGPAITGETSSAIAMSLVLTSVFTFGLALGPRRFLGKAFMEKNAEYFREVAQFVVVSTIGCMVVISLVILLFNDILITLFEISEQMTTVILLATLSYALAMALRSILESHMKGKEVMIIFLIGNAVRFLSLIPVFYWNTGAEGVTLAYVSFYILASVLMVFSARKQIFGKTIHRGLRLVSQNKEVYKASLTGWVPNVINAIGNQSSVLFVFGVSGAAEAGIYYMAFGIYLAIFALPQAILTVLFPVMSGMKEKREELLWKAINASYFVTAPLAIAITIHPLPLLSLFGEEFLTGGLTMSLLAISVLPLIIHRSVNFLAYSYGRYQEVLSLGVIPNVARVVLYVILVNEYGGVGVAASFLIGSVIGVIVGVIISQVRDYQIKARKILVMTAIPVGIGLFTYYFDFNSIASIFAIIFGSYLIVGRIRIIKYSEIEEISNSIFGYNKRILYLAKFFFR